MDAAGASRDRAGQELRRRGADASGAPTERQVEVRPDYDLLVAVDAAWEGAAEPAPSFQLHLVDLAAANGAGSDIDGDGAADPWYAPCFDCFFLHKNPTWGDLSTVDDDPVWTRTLQPNAHDEQIGIPTPQPGRTYLAGVYRWPVPAAPAITAQLRVFTDGELAYQAPAKALLGADFWCAAQISWPSAADQAPKIAPCPGVAMIAKAPPPSPATKFGCGL